MLSERISLYDANDVECYYGYNYSIEGTEIVGYIVLGPHSKANLINMTSTSGGIDTSVDKIYYFTNGEMYYETADGFRTIDNSYIPKDEFEEYRAYKLACYFNVSRPMLDNIVNENEVIINCLQSEEDILAEDVYMGKHYSGTDSEAYGYGGITNITKYLKSQCGGKPTVSDSEKSLSVNTSTMSSISGKNANNCSLVGISKVLYYWRSKKS